MKYFYLPILLVLLTISSTLQAQEAFAPKVCPEFGITLPIKFHRSRDADTHEVKLPGGSTVWAIRLIKTWSPELNRGTEHDKRIARLGTIYASKVLSESDDLRLFIPIRKDFNLRGTNLLKAFSFDRIPGYIYVGKYRTLNQMLIDEGFASSTKKGRLGQ